jgi:Zn-dependent protease
MQCEFCGKDEALPFVCNYCGGVYCADHRLPEAHRCKGDLSTKRTIVAPSPSPSTASGYSWGGGYGYTTRPTPAKHGVFSKVEVRDIIIAWFTLGVAFLFTYQGALATIGVASSGLAGTMQVLVFLGVFLITVGSGFVLHELSHKFTAQRYGFWAEFRMWPLGLLLALGSALLIGFLFAAPGATYIMGENITIEENGKISLAGPITNIVIAAAFLPFLLVGQGILQVVGYFGVYVNVILALFNMLPIFPLDGSKVFKWNKPVWVTVFVALLLVFFYQLGAA